MNKQMSLSFIHDELKEVKTHKREFLEKMDAILPWEQLYKLVKPCYYEGVRGNKPYDLELMLRIHLIQNLYDLSDEGTRNEIIDSRAFSDFCEVESSNQIPDGDTIGRFRNLLTVLCCGRKDPDRPRTDSEKRNNCRFHYYFCPVLHKKQGEKA